MSEYLQGLLDQHWQLLNEVEEDKRIDKERNARLLREARKWLHMAQQFLDAGMIGQRDEVARFGFSAMLDAAKKSMMMACAEDVLLAGVEFKERMSRFGRLGADARWNGRKPITQIYATLAAETDALGDPIPSNDLWPELFSFLDGLELDPKEIEHENDIQKDVIEWQAGEVTIEKTTYNISADKISRGGFKNKISEIRNTSS